MQQIRFGQTGLRVSKLCLGTMGLGSSAWKGWVLDEDAAVPILKRALDKGINFFDMADWYSLGRGEEVVGRNLLRMEPRERLVLADIPREQRHGERDEPPARAVDEVLAHEVLA